LPNSLGWLQLCPSRKKGIELENLNLYRPTLIHYLIFLKEKKVGKTTVKEDPIKVSFEEEFAKDSQVTEEAEYIIVEIHKELKTQYEQESKKGGIQRVDNVGIVGGSDDGPGAEGWAIIEPTMLLNQINYIKTSGEKTAQQTLKDNDFLRYIGNYTLTCCGSKKNYWLETQIDVRGFLKGGKARQLKGMTAKSRIKSLNWMLTGANQFRGDALGVTGTPSNLYGFGNISYRLMEQFKGLFLVDITMESEGETESAAELGERYKGRTETVSRSIGKFLAFHSLLMNHNKMEYNDVDRQANILRREVLRIQERIFNLQKAGQDSKSADKLTDMKKMQSEEEDLLTSASITFSTVTRLEQEIGTNLYTCFGLNKSLEEITDTMAPTRIDTAEGEFEPVSSLFDEFNRFNDSVTVSYEMLRDNVNITQTTLRNSLEVLRTFIEHQRSRISDLQSKTFSIILVIFACFGIADALSNLLAFYISDRSVEAAALTAGAFVFSMMFSLMIFAILYIVIIKKVLA